jgi:hypothetical protein
VSRVAVLTVEVPDSMLLGVSFIGDICVDRVPRLFYVLQTLQIHRNFIQSLATSSTRSIAAMLTLGPC